MIVLIGLAGGLGAATRFVVDGEIRRRFSTTFPWATVTINVSGSLLLGLLAGVVLFHGTPDDRGHPAARLDQGRTGTTTAVCTATSTAAALAHTALTSIEPAPDQGAPALGGGIPCVN